MSKKRIHITIFIYILALIIILISLYIYSFNIKNFNKQKRIYDQANPSKHFSIELKARDEGGWNKKIGKKMYTGITYDANLENKSIYAISTWKMRVNIKSDFYINKAWCGKIEICQKGKTQLFDDLRAANLQDITKLEFRIVDTEVLIPLNKGDYFVYYPSKEANETPIKVSDPKNKLFRSATVGFIFYFPKKDKLDLTDIKIDYTLHNDYKTDINFWIIIGFLIFWFLCVVFYILLLLHSRKIRKQLAHDEIIIEQAINVFTQFFDAKDVYTNGHSKRVAYYTEEIAKKMGYNESSARYIRYIALMHDCGKVFIPDEILKKPSRLTNEEFAVIKTHTNKGAEMLKNFDSIKCIQEGAMYHHERYDGKGYPSGKKGEDIPLIGRMICVADAFDAMNSKRCYRDKLSTETILNELENNKGKQFDPKIVDIFIELIKSGDINFDKEIIDENK